MDATALVCDKQQNISLLNVRLKEPDADDLVVRTLYSGVSPGTELALLQNKISWGPFPLCTGYQGVGVVEAVGANVHDFKPGERVYYRGNTPMTTPGGEPISPVSGTHCSHAVVPPGRIGTAVLPEGVDPASASLFVMPAVGLAGVDMANPRIGASVIVHGVGPIGLGVVAACAHRGCRVIAIDLDDHRLKLAAAFGAEQLINATKKPAAEQVADLLPDGADVVFEATGLPSCIDPAIRMCRTFGTFVWQGNYGAQPIQMQFMEAHMRRLTMYFPCDDGGPACRHAVLSNMARGGLAWDRTITHRVSASDAPALYTRMLAGQAGDVIGAVVQWE
ncbi:zinc-binding dehydrogenase [Phycisphaerales bacterium AB-hyl4]|uniref:Zinc-binding dehydrogenase n=1 Tax=Natronomicrosphaera hydrolytica TaxID=3242702 RepID=A0ABV4UAJ5_9BACT